MPKSSEVSLTCVMCLRMFRKQPLDRPSPVCNSCLPEWKKQREELLALPEMESPCEICPFRRKTSGWISPKSNELSILAIRENLPVTCARHAHKWLTSSPKSIRCPGIGLIDKDPEFLTSQELLSLNRSDEDASKYYGEMRHALLDGLEIPETTVF